jgi:hypothetical protein
MQISNKSLNMLFINCWNNVGVERTHRPEVGVEQVAKVCEWSEWWVGVLGRGLLRALVMVLVVRVLRWGGGSSKGGLSPCSSSGTMTDPVVSRDWPKAGGCSTE